MIINEIDLFKDIDFEVMNEIAGTVLFQKDEDANFLFILLEGTLHLVIKNGGSIIYHLTDPGEVFGWSSMVEGGRYTATGTCATDLKAVKIGRRQLDKVFREHPLAGYMVLQRLAGVISKRLSNSYRDLLSARSIDTTPSYG
jgi:CRP-like cAMP-binding protein